ncbi:Myosin head (motor domain) family protein [Cryptosporidium meleagridis]|uniref:Myosin head (Motor domain) family protein n=1 Tax=Cryptosporidium meleagridis TaxID=93969 RepID=A0A2P4YY03_9CRYT|nr:Myosin head (motor domain) family protein [Cryptosporidium meleagridis]
MNKKNNPQKEMEFKRRYSMVGNDELLIDTPVWVKCPENGINHNYKVGIIKSFGEKTIHVSIEGGEEIDVDFNMCFNYNVGIDAMQINDLTKLPHVSEASVLDVINKRFSMDLIYSYAGRLLVAVNPFKMIEGLYGPEKIRLYKGADYSMGFPSDLPPHTFAVAQRSMQLLDTQKINQSCIVSGESGAGKTETARQLMTYFASSGMGSDNKVQEVILGANPLLEALGNAKTLRNNNSSRFGRFIKLCLERSNGIVGGAISSYMLELSRIGHQIENERSYHIFYQIIKSYTSQADISKYKLREMDWYKYLNVSNCYDVQNIDDIKEFKNCVFPQLERILPNQEAIDQLISLFSAILLMGNFELGEHESRGIEDAACIESQDILSDVSELWGIDSKQFEELLLTSSIEIRGNVVVSALNKAKAQEQIESCGKEVYLKCFEYLIDLVNKAIEFDDNKRQWIGILDIYGFEVFKVNGFEQFLINFANEKLQQFFISSVFQAELQEYEKESISHDNITYEDNSSLVQLFDGKGGIFDLLEESCLVSNGTFESFTNSAHKNCGKKSGYKLPKGNVPDKFIIEHTATTVEYTTREFVLKNKHRIRPEIIKLFKESKNSIIKGCFEKVEILNSNKLKGKFLASIFRVSIGHLLDTLKATNAQFIRCVKANEKKVPNLIEADMVVDQLQSLSIMEAILLVQKGYAYRETFENFMKENSMIMKLMGQTISSGSDLKQQCRQAMNTMKIPESEWQIGNTKIFIKKDGWIAVERFFRSVTKSLAPLAETLREIFRLSKLRKQLKEFSVSLIRCQSLVRMYILNKEGVAKNRLLNYLIGVSLIMNLPNAMRNYNRSIVTIQRIYRGHRVRKEIGTTLRRKAACKKFVSFVKLLVNVLKAKNTFLDILRRIKSEAAAKKLQSAWIHYKKKRLVILLRIYSIKQAKAIKIQRVWRYYYLRQIMIHYIRIATPARKIQSVWRGYYVRKTIQHSHFFEKIRIKLWKSEYVMKIQCLIKRYWILAHLDRLYWVADVLQPRLHSALTRLYWKNMLKSIKCIQSWWRGDRVRQIIREEKLFVLLMAEKVRTDFMTQNECQILVQWDLERRNKNRVVIGSKLEKSPKGLQIIQILVEVDTSREYPAGWMESITGLLRSGSSIQEVGIGGFHTVVLTCEGSLYSFGMNDKSQLGLGKPGSELLGRALIKPGESLSIQNKIKSISCGVDHSLALSEMGSVYCWGANEYGQCGCDATEYQISAPTLISLPADWKQTRITLARAGAFHCVAVTIENEVLVWGRGDDLGLEDVHDSLFIPMQLRSPAIKKLGRINSLSCGLGTTFMIGINGVVLVFGVAQNGILGLGKGVYSTKRPKILSNISRVSQISLGYNFALALTTNGEVYQWGQVPVWNEYLEKTLHKNFFTPKLVDLSELKSHVVEIQSGWWHSVVRLKNNSIWSWTFVCEVAKELNEKVNENQTKQKSEKNVSEGAILRSINSRVEISKGEGLIPILFKFDLAEDRCTKCIKVVSSPSMTVVMRGGKDHISREYIIQPYLLENFDKGQQGEISSYDEDNYSDYNVMDDSLNLHAKHYGSAGSDLWGAVFSASDSIDIFEDLKYPALRNPDEFTNALYDTNQSIKKNSEGKIFARQAKVVELDDYSSIKSGPVPISNSFQSSRKSKSSNLK